MDWLKSMTGVIEPATSPRTGYIESQEEEASHE